MAHISRQELKSDEFVSGMDAAFEALQQHRESLIKGGIVVLVAAAIGFGYYSWNHHRSAAADAALTAAMATQHAQIGSAPAIPGTPTFPTIQARATAAERQFQGVIQQYGSTSAGHIAKYYLGLAQMDLNDPNAEKTLQEAANSGGSEAEALAKHALANYYVQRQQPQKALDLLQQLAKTNSPSLPAPVALLEMADLQRISNPAAATKIYQQLQSQYPMTSMAQDASEALAALKVH